jgi:hypothetical protein
VLAISFPSLLKAFKPQGAFGWYAAWCMSMYSLHSFEIIGVITISAVGWTAVLFTLPETKALTLEELDFVFSVSTIRHAKYQLKNAIWHFRRYVLFQRNLKPLAPLYEIEDLVPS